MKKRELRIVIAGGGTGGHLFPGIAIARELQKRCEEARILFIVGRKKMEKDIISKAGFENRSVDVEGIVGKDLLQLIGAFFKVVISSIQSFFILKDFKPHLIVGVGGYASGPVCLMGWFLQIPTAIQEQNSIPGITNRILTHIVKKVFISFEESRKYFKRGKLFFTGNPIRDELMNPEILPKKGYQTIDKAMKQRFVILIMGGSQGARAINKAVLSALKEIKDRGFLPFAIHQTGTQDLEEVRATYHSLRIEAEVTSFIDNMALAYAKADLVICRAGATTIAELTALGKPSILVPYPYATHKHQDINARALANYGGAESIQEKDLTGRILAEKITKYMENPDMLTQMSSFALKAGRPLAREAIAKELMELIGGSVSCQ